MSLGNENKLSHQYFSYRHTMLQQEVTFQPSIYSNLELKLQ